ncbi:MAG: energy-coupling factor transporter ATPase [Oscillospiraceae bacterium]|nr:energy-coupling factor transporter ATPase [Oscillospiraceae bacterium]
MSFIDIDNVTFTYTTEDDNGNVEKNEVLHGLSLSIDKGEFVAVLGHNGSGKSTLAKLLNAINLPDSGKVTVAGMDTADEDKLFDIRSNVGMVFQNPDNQIVATIVEEDVAFALENIGVEPSEIRRRVDEALKTVGMYDYREHSPSKLSGGQKQRVAIAGVLAMKPDCIVLDEPTAMLDPIGRREIMSTITELNKSGVTIVLITHYMDEAARAKRVVVMDSGNIIMDDCPKKVFSQVEKLKSLGLDVPQVTELTHELIECGVNLPEDIIYEDECYEALYKLLKVGSVSLRLTAPEVRLRTSFQREPITASIKASERSSKSLP